jgi:hypothetical protein
VLASACQSPADLSDSAGLRNDFTSFRIRAQEHHQSFRSKSDISGLASLRRRAVSTTVIAYAMFIPLYAICVVRTQGVWLSHDDHWKSSTSIRLALRSPWEYRIHLLSGETVSPKAQLLMLVTGVRRSVAKSKKYSVPGEKKPDDPETK